MNIKEISSIKSNDGKIYYISPYIPEKDELRKYVSPAAQTKAGYIRSAIKDNLVTVSVNCSLNAGNLIAFQKEFKDDYGDVCMLQTIASTIRWLLPICYLRLVLAVFTFVLFNVKRDDIIILYHSVLYDRPVLILKHFLKFKLLYEVEEIYADVRENGKGSRKEINIIQKNADAYIFPTEMLNEKVNKNNLPFLIIYGSYNNEYHQNTHTKNKNKNKIVVVYSGILMKGKGVDNVIRCATHLNAEYEIRIVGFGSENDIQRVRNLIKKNHSKCVVLYDGLKHGKEYTEYLEKCDIGLCIQAEDMLFNNTSFPSKILSYLGCELKVVVSRISAVENSKIASVLTFTKSSSIEDVADAIKIAAQSENNESEYILQELNSNTITGLDKIFALLRSNGENR